MINTADIEKVVALTLASGYVEGEKPVSLMLVSDRPESGKTEIVKQFSKIPNIAIVNDMTAFAMWRDFGSAIAKGDIKHFIMPEFLAPISRKSTVDSFIATLQMMIEEGLTEIHTGFLEPIKFDSPKVIGVIVCMPRNTFKGNRLNWDISGFLSRFVLATYKYNDDTVKKIFDSIFNQEYLQETKQPLKFKTASITIPKSIRAKCLSMAVEITKQARKDGKCYGFRELKNIIRFVASMVILDNANGATRHEANEADFEEVARLSYLFNEEFNSLREEESQAKNKSKLLAPRPEPAPKPIPEHDDTDDNSEFTRMESEFTHRGMIQSAADKLGTTAKAKEGEANKIKEEK